MRFILAAIVSFALASEGLAHTVEVSAYANPFGIPGQDVKSEYFGATALNAFVGCRPTGDPPTLCELTTAEADADLATGELGIYARAGGSTDLRQASALATFSDSLVFNVPSGMPSASITFTMNVHGVIAAVPGGTGSWTLGATMDLGGEAAFLVFPVYSSGPFSQVGSVTTTVSDQVPVSMSAALHGYVDTWSLQPGVFLDGPIIIDALHTASLSISLPPGVTFQSESGVFLTQVSEPSVLQLLLLAVPGIAAASRLRR